ncbi:hypothetical protein HJC23_007744 [Cyclotella cryptica]|uniref:Uncharacterized protein n=1 Tax=Cyclotella cryptica TaxID=29204 RepID=A0ABD3QZV3_9STRA|eukprot:CCRYP_000022-RA/>CCRYP_000022-RA protein AED:0.02 eAED:0.02 QI:402/1/1/1/0.5/0.33/3/1744/1005
MPTSMSNRYKNNELLFQQKIQSQLLRVRSLLNTPSTAYPYSYPRHQRSPVYFSDYPKHAYQDKFGLAEFLTNVAIASQMNVLDVLGVDEEKFRLMHRIVNGLASGHEMGGRSDPYAGCNRLILRFTAEENCNSFDQEQSISADSGDSIGTPTSVRRKSTDQVQRLFAKKNINRDNKDHHWKVTVDYTIKVLATQSYDPAINVGIKNDILRQDPPSISLKSRTAVTTLHTASNTPRPLQTKVVRDPIDFELTWLFKNISSEDFSCNFRIDQSHPSCRSPRRNRDVDEALKYFSELEGWCNDICTYFLKGACWNVDLSVMPTNINNAVSASSSVQMKESRCDMNLETIDAESVFVPVLPILEPPSSALMRKTDSNSKRLGELMSLSPLLPIDDIRLFLNEQCRTLDEKIQECVSNFPPADSTSHLITSAEATLFLLFSHSASITDYFVNGLQAIEQAMVDSLTKACGVEVTQRDLEKFLRCNNKKLFCDDMYMPLEFNFDIKRPNRVPEGIVRIEMRSVTSDFDEAWPILTATKEINLAPGEEKHHVEIKIPSIASMVQISGKCCIHGWLTHQFLSTDDFRYQIMAASRHFSSFLLLTGNVSHNHCMNVKTAMLIQNEDEVTIPLHLSRALPVGDFHSRVSSLSPQQQSFAQAAAITQLDSSVFCVCVVEVRPQLELLMRLPPDSLTKEVSLVTTLLSLFVEHQISADLVSYDGPENVPAKEMIATVKEYVQNVLVMVNDTSGDGQDDKKSAELPPVEVGEMQPKANVPFQRGNRRASRDDVSLDARFDREKVCTSHDDNTSLATDSNRALNDGIFRKKQSYDSIETNAALDELSQHAAVERFSIDSAPQVIRQLPSIDYLEFLGEEDFSSTGIASMARKLNMKLAAHQNKQLQQVNITTGEVWEKRNARLPKSSVEELDNAERQVNTKKAMHLLDALSRSGSLPIKFAQLHALVGATHCFGHSLIDTLVISDVDPIKQMSNSMALLASVIHDTPVGDIIKTKTKTK